MRNVKAFARRLRRLEQPSRWAVKIDEEALEMQRRSDAGRLRCGLPAISPESRAKRSAELKGMGMISILNAGRQRVSDAQKARREDGS